MRDIKELSGIQKAFLLLIMGWVLVVFIAPSVDLPDTVLNNTQSLYGAMFCILALTAAIIPAVTLVFCRQRESHAIRSTPCLFPLLCLFLC